MDMNQNQTTATAGRTLRIGVDFDGVLFDHVPYLLRGFRDAHDIDLQAEGLRYWDFFQYRAVRERDLSWSCVHAILRKIENDPALHDAEPLDPDAAGVMQRWRQAGHTVEVVTAREATCRDTTEYFLRTHQIPHDRLRMGVALKTGYDVLIDDAPHNVLMAAASGSIALLMDHPYNQDVPTQRNPVRIRSWKEAEQHVERILKQSESRPEEARWMPASPVAATIAQ
jgi:uncharacterized HAD superfamily protein